MCAKESLSLVLVRTIIKGKNKFVLSQTFPSCLLGLGGLAACWFCVFQRARSKTKTCRVGAFSSEKETLLFFGKEKERGLSSFCVTQC